MTSKTNNITKDAVCGSDPTVSKTIAKGWVIELSIKGVVIKKGWVTKYYCQLWKQINCLWYCFWCFGILNSEHLPLEIGSKYYSPVFNFWILGDASSFALFCHWLAQCKCPQLIYSNFPSQICSDKWVLYCHEGISALVL